MYQTTRKEATVTLCVSDRRQNAYASKLCQKIQYLTRVLQIPTDTCEKPVGGYLTLTQGFMTLVNSKRTIIAASREITFDVKGTHRMSTRRSMAGGHGLNFSQALIAAHNS